MDYARAHYDDGSVACDETGLAIQRYYPWGARRILYGEIRDISVLPMSAWAAMAPWKIWGPTDLEHWWNLDAHRAEKHVALVIDTGERFKPTVTPCDPEGFEMVIRGHLSGLTALRETAALARLMADYHPAAPPIPQQREVPAEPQVVKKPAARKKTASV